MKQIFIDLETTGLNPKVDVITEISCIYKHNGKIKKRFTLKIMISLSDTRSSQVLHIKLSLRI